jgi:predicted enzyme related to lactoylglutathione lyase
MTPARGPAHAFLRHARSRASRATNEAAARSGEQVLAPPRRSGTRRTSMRTRRLITATAVLAACATAATKLPRIQPEPTNVVTPGRPVWHDLVTSDLEAAKRFYGGVFGWTFEDFQLKVGRYALASLGGKPVAGIIHPGQREVNVSQWLTYFSVDDVDAAVAVGTKAGAKLAVPPRDIAGQGRAALLLDPHGAPVALARLKGGDPARARPPLNGWLWVDLWTPDPAASLTFYRTLLGFEPEVVMLAQARYTVLGRGDVAYAGMIRIPEPEIRPNWLPIVRVADARVAAERAAELGGRVILAPRPEIREGKAAIIADPTGGAVAVHVWDLAAGGARAETEVQR